MNADLGGRKKKKEKEEEKELDHKCHELYELRE
jgi:hypothetical protein